MLAILIICLVIFGAISLPIGIAMGLATMLCLVFATNIDPIMVARTRNGSTRPLSTSSRT